MKKQILSLIAILFVNQMAFATIAEIKDLQLSITERKSNGLSNVKLMKNAQKEVLGFYTWEKSGGENMYAEICEYVADGDLTLASNWSYWRGDANPASFKKNRTYHTT